MSPALDPWHFARPALAASYLKEFETGFRARALFGFRRMGKSTFLRRDLLPSAAAEGYLPVYVDLGREPEDPGHAIARAATQAAGLTLSPPTDAALLRNPNRAATLLAVESVLEAIGQVNKPLLLVIDEAQVLGAGQHADVAQTLQAGLARHVPAVKTLFAGSLQTALRALFDTPSGPFYQAAQLELFPPLGDEFARAMVALLASLARTPLEMDEGLAAFEVLNRTPEYFRWYLERYLAYQPQGSAEALRQTLVRVDGDTGHAKVWLRLSRAERAVLFLAARGCSNLFEPPARAQLATMLGVGVVSADVPRAALRRLTGPFLQLMVRVEQGAYHFDDVELRAWVAARQSLD